MSIRKLLSPLLVMSYVCGLRVIEYPAGVSRRWFSLLYILLLWSLYNYVFIYVVIPYTFHYSMLYHIWIGINISMGFLSIIGGIYYDKAFKNCIKNFTIMDDTLEKLGTITDYKLRTKIIWLIIGWFIIAIFSTYDEIILLTSKSLSITAQNICINFMRVYCIHINVIGDLTITSMLGYVRLKLDQINEHLEKLTEGNERKLMRAWEHPVLLFHQSRYAKTSRNAYIIWIVMHLHSELRKISRQIDLIFGTQMTMEMGCSFAFIALNLQEVFNLIFIEHYRENNKITLVRLLLVYLFLHVFRLFLINYECEKISIKAKATGYFLTKLSYSGNCDVEIRESLVQFLLMTQLPFRFYGLGFFQFGFKFLQGFITSVVTVLVILLQGYTNKQI